MIRNLKFKLSLERFSVSKLNFCSTQTEMVSRCRENIHLLEVALIDGSLSVALQKDVKGLFILLFF